MRKRVIDKCIKVRGQGTGYPDYLLALQVYYNSYGSSYPSYSAWLAATYNTIDNSTITPSKYYYQNVRGIDPRYPTYRDWIGLFGYSINTPPAVPAPVEPDPVSADNVTLNKVLNVVQTILDIAGFIPGIGDIADGVNTGICLLRGDLLGAALSAIGIIPVVGSAISVPLKTIFKAAGNITEVRAAINVLAGVFGGLDKVVEGLTSAMNIVRGLIRGLADLVASLTGNTFVRNLIGNDGVQAIGTMVTNIRNKVDNLINKADEVISSARKSVIMEASGLTQAKIDEILSLPNGSRPDPSTYLRSDYITSHLAKFDGGVTKIMSYTPTGTAGPAGGTFVMPTSLIDDLTTKAGGSISKLEEFLGYNPGDLGTNPVRVDIPAPNGLRMPSGNEMGVIEGKWSPGGYTSGGIPEAIINSPEVGTYIVRSLFN